MEAIEDIGRLREILGEPGPLTRHKIHRSLSRQARAFVLQSPFFMLASVDSHGCPTVSPKGDTAGFVHVEDENTLLIPERSGNRLLFTLENVLRNPRVGLIFLSPGTDETLRVSGRATLLLDTELNERFAARDKPALLVMCIAIDECYFHCAKAFLRSELWKPASWPQAMRVSFAEEININRKLESDVMRDLDTQIAGRYRTDL